MRVGQALARRMGFHIGTRLSGGSEPRVLLQSSLPQFLVTGLLATGGAEDDAIISSARRGSASFKAARQYRKLYVSALTKRKTISRGAIPRQ